MRPAPGRPPCPRVPPRCTASRRGLPDAPLDGALYDGLRDGHRRGSSLRWSGLLSPAAVVVDGGLSPALAGALAWPIPSSSTSPMLVGASCTSGVSGPTEPPPRLRSKAGSPRFRWL